MLIADALASTQQHSPSLREDGSQTRSFLHVDECVEGTLRLVQSNFQGPVNIGSEEMVSIDTLVAIVSEISGRTIKVKHVPGPVGVRGRNSSNALIFEKLKWKPTKSLKEGLQKTYTWIKHEVESRQKTIP